MLLSVEVISLLYHRCMNWQMLYEANKSRYKTLCHFFFLNISAQYAVAILFLLMFLLEISFLVCSEKLITPLHLSDLLLFTASVFRLIKTASLDYPCYFLSHFLVWFSCYCDFLYHQTQTQTLSHRASLASGSLAEAVAAKHGSAWLRTCVCKCVYSERLTSFVANGNFIPLSLLHVHEHGKNTCALLSPVLLWSVPTPHSFSG